MGGWREKVLEALLGQTRNLVQWKIPGSMTMTLTKTPINGIWSLNWSSSVIRHNFHWRKSHPNLDTQPLIYNCPAYKIC